MKFVKNAFFLIGGLCLLWAWTAAPAQGQQPPRQIRTYVPPDQLVSFLPSTPFDQFIEFINPIFERVTGKQVVDPVGRTEPIGLTITSLQFLDALEYVLDLKGLTYRETELYFFIEQAPQTNQVVFDGDTGLATAGPVQAALAGPPASVNSREVQINAILFDANLSKALELGIDWNVWFGPLAGGQGGGIGGGGAAGGGFGTGADGALQSTNVPRFFLNTRNFSESVSEFLVAPRQISLSGLFQLLRVFENEGLGKTLAHPSVTVQSGQEGNIQIGSDVPVQQRDFAGNTITNFFSTGIIIEVTPTVIRETTSDSLGSPEVEFIHLDVKVENSSSRPTSAGVVIDRNTADTQVLLLDGEQTVIGGLYSTERSIDRRGIPILKDLPPWFFGLRYLFGYNRTDQIQRELVIILQAKIRDPLETRSQMPFPDELIERQRRQVEEDLRRVDSQASRNLPFPGKKEN